MAILQLTLANCRDEIRRRIGERTGGTTISNPNVSDAELTRQINLYLQRLPRRTAQLTQSPREIKFDMWRTFSDLTETAGSSTVYLPVDYDRFISFWDKTNGDKLMVVKDVEKYYRKRKHLDRADTDRTGPPEAIEILGFASNSGTWQRKALLHPNTASGVTPDIRITYWRLPATVSSDSDTLDLDIKYQDVAIYGPLLEFYRDDDPAYQRYEALEREILIGLAKTASVI